MNNHNTHQEIANATDTDEQQKKQRQQCHQLFQPRIKALIEEILADTQLAQSDDGKRILEGLRTPGSTIYADALKALIEERITELEGVPNPSEDVTQMIYFLKKCLSLGNEAHPQPLDTEPRIPLQTADIPHAIMLDTVEKITLGWTRIDVAKHLMRQDPLPEWLHPLAEMDKTEAVNLLSQRLRSADPYSDKFSHTKYQEHADAVIEQAQQALKDKVYNLIDAQVKAFEQTDADFAQLIKTAKKEIDQTEDTTQRRQSVKLWMSLNKQKDERAKLILTHFQQILAANQTT